MAKAKTTINPKTIKGEITYEDLIRGRSAVEVRKIIAQLSPEDQSELLYRWPFWARKKQRMPPGKWRVWAQFCGRGYGKTRSGAEAVKYMVESGKAKRIAIVGRTADDAKKVLVQGVSGILAVSHPKFRPIHQPGNKLVIWPNGAIAETYSADKPEQMRGPGYDLAWADELAWWRYKEAWDNLQFATREGDCPQIIVTTTPRPTKVIKGIQKRSENSSGRYILVRGSMYENAGNLPESFIEDIETEYGGTRLGRQEIYGEILDDNPNAIFKRKDIEAARVERHPPLIKILVAVDPQAKNKDESAKTGIVTVGLGDDYEFYVLSDDTIKGTPDKWGREAVAAYNKYSASAIVCEDNQGGDMVEFVIKTIGPLIPLKRQTAVTDKKTRAAPVSALCEQHRIHHVGTFPELEDQMCEWQPGPGIKSPDIMDAMVWGIRSLCDMQETRRIEFDTVAAYGTPLSLLN